MALNVIKTCFIFSSNFCGLQNINFHTSQISILRGSFWKSFVELAVPALSDVKHSTVPLCFKSDKHSCSFFKCYFTRPILIGRSQNANFLKMFLLYLCSDLAGVVCLVLPGRYYWLVQLPLHR